MWHNDALSTKIADITAVGLALGSVTEYLPAIASALSILWMAIRIYETPTVQGWLYGKKEKHDDE